MFYEVHKNSQMKQLVCYPKGAMGRRICVLANNKINMQHDTTIPSFFYTQVLHKMGLLHAVVHDNIIGFFVFYLHLPNNKIAKRHVE